MINKTFDYYDMINFAKYFKRRTDIIHDSDSMTEAILQDYIDDYMICQRCGKDPCECCE